MLDADGAVKLVDFGLSVVWREGGRLCKANGTPCCLSRRISAASPPHLRRISAASPPRRHALLHGA